MEITTERRVNKDEEKISSAMGRPFKSKLMQKFVGMKIGELCYFPEEQWDLKTTVEKTIYYFNRRHTGRRLVVDSTRNIHSGLVTYCVSCMSDIGVG